MAGCKRCALKGGKGKVKKKRKEKKKGGKNGNQNLLFFFVLFFISFKYVGKTISRLSRSYPLLFAIKILMLSQFGDL